MLALGLLYQPGPDVFLGSDDDAVPLHLAALVLLLLAGLAAVARARLSTIKAPRLSAANPLSHCVSCPDPLGLHRYVAGCGRFGDAVWGSAPAVVFLPCSAVVSLPRPAATPGDFHVTSRYIPSSQVLFEVSPPREILHHEGGSVTCLFRWVGNQCSSAMW